VRNGKYNNKYAIQNSTLSVSAGDGELIFDARVSDHAFIFGGLSGNSYLCLRDYDSNPVSLSVGNNNASTTCSGRLSGPGSLTKIGSGTLTLSGTNTYTGPTMVSVGTLKLAKAIANNIATSPIISINRGATLDVTGLSDGRITLTNSQTLRGGGTVAGGVVTVNGSHLAPGISTLTVDTLNMASGSIYDYEFNNILANGLINVNATSGLTINGGGFNLYNQGSTTPFATPGTYKLLQYSGTVGGIGPSALSVLNTLPGRTYAFSASSGQIDLTIQPTTPPAQPRLEPPPPPSSPKKNLILYTHGWNTSEAQWNDPNGCWRELDQALKANVDTSNWLVLGHDWTADDGDLATGPGYALNRAVEYGSMIGTAIADAHYDHVHLIAHSAGSALISTVAAIVTAKSPETSIQTTYLDPYAPSSYYTSLYGSHREQDWSDSYIAKDWTWFTQPTLPNAHNVDVTRLDPNFALAKVSSHGWPIDFYVGTIPPASVPGAGEYGYPRSLEGGGWDTRSSYPLGQTVVLGGPGTGTPENLERHDAPLDFSALATCTGESGAVTIAGTSFTLTTGSPVWMSSLLTVTEAVNELMFNADFVDNGAEGLLAVYWNDQYVGQVDQRYVLDGSQQYSFFLSQVFDPGVYSLAFRLDPYTDVQASVLIDSVATGYVVPEPSAFTLLCVAAIVLLGCWRQRRRRRNSARTI